MKLLVLPLRYIERLVRDCWSRRTVNLCRELSLRKVSFQRESKLPLQYKGIRLDCGYRIDILVADLIVVEIKAVEGLVPVHQAQLLTYLRLGGWKVGLLINFNVVVLKDGILRRML